MHMSIQQFFSKFPSSKRARFGIALVSLVAVVAIGVSVPSIAAGKKSGNGLVIFTANWCASCRNVAPIVQEVGSQNGIAVHSIDVDLQDAPSQASNFGLTIPSADLPQVYYVEQGHVNLLFDARQYKFTKPEVIRNQILSNLQQSKTN